MGMKVQLFFSCFPSLTSKFESKIHLGNVGIYIYIFFFKQESREVNSGAAVPVIPSSTTTCSILGNPFGVRFFPGTDHNFRAFLI